MVPTFLSRVVPEWIVWLHCVSVHVVCVCVWCVCSFVGGIFGECGVCSCMGVVCMCKCVVHEYVCAAYMYR